MKYFIVLALVTLSLSPRTWAYDSRDLIRFTENIKDIPVEGALSFADNDRQVSIDSIRARDTQGLISWRSVHQFNFGYTHAPLWFKITVKNENPHNSRWVLELGYPLIQEHKDS